LIQATNSQKLTFGPYFDPPKLELENAYKNQITASNLKTLHEKTEQIIKSEAAISRRNAKALPQAQIN